MREDLINENKMSSETRLEKASVEASEALDTIPLYLTHEEREVLILFLNEVSKLSAIHVERVIQTAYLFNIADLPFELNGSPYLTGFVEAYRQYKSPQSNKKEFFEAVKKLEQYLLPEGKINAEMKRQKLITEVNKLVPKIYAVPSHKLFSNIILQILNEKGYILATRHKSKTLWSVNPDFYKKWLARRHQLFEERTQKIKEFQNAGIAPDQAEINANEYMINKYSIIVLDFYNINYIPYQTDKINSTKLDIKFKQSLVLKYIDDILRLTRY